jgi:hypothetical protein
MDADDEGRAFQTRPLTSKAIADAAFVDGTHRFHEVFVDFYFLRKIIRPGGLIVIDDNWAPSVRTAVHYYEQNLGWTAIPHAFASGTPRATSPGLAARAVARCQALRLPDSFGHPDTGRRPGGNLGVKGCRFKVGRPDREVQVRKVSMSAQREELLRLVEELPETEVPAVLDDVRRHLRAVKSKPWPPAWFGAGQGSTSDVAARAEDLLDGFGRPA